MFTSESLSVTGLPLYSTMTSPRRSPARSAGESGATDETTAPFVFGRPSSLARSFVTGSRPISTPMTPREILPVRSCGSSSRMVLIGVANPMPMFAARCASV
jgi:hypothetical protein